MNDGRINPGRVIKWDGDPPTEPDAYVNPEQHPKCAEIIEFADNVPARVTFTKEPKTQESSRGTD